MSSFKYALIMMCVVVAGYPNLKIKIFKYYFFDTGNFFWKGDIINKHILDSPTILRFILSLYKHLYKWAIKQKELDKIEMCCHIEAGENMPLPLLIWCSSDQR